MRKLVGLPERDADTMSDAIALSSPSGRMSKRGRNQANSCLASALFGNAHYVNVTTPGERAGQLRASAKNLRELAARGMSKRAFTRQAEKLEAEANGLEPIDES